jgi:hypothetical protein
MSPEYFPVFRELLQGFYLAAAKAAQFLFRLLYAHSGSAAITDVCPVFYQQLGREFIRWFGPAAVYAGFIRISSDFRLVFLGQVCAFTLLGLDTIVAYRNLIFEV